MAKNQYEKAAEKESLLGSITKDLDTHKNLKNTAIETAKDVVVGAVAGGAVGSALGRFSLLAGAVVTGVGHYFKSRLAAVFGLGIMSATGYKAGQTVQEGTKDEKTTQGLNGLIEGAKDRVMSFKDSLQEKLFLDKILKQGEKKEGKSVGEVSYFTYPENKELEGGEEKELDMTALDRLERKVQESGEEYIQKQQKPGEISGGEMGEIDPTEKNY